MHVTQIATALLAGALAALGVHAQPTYSFEHLQVPGGGEENGVTSIAQDSLGFLWMGTWAGLHRYDGYAFTAYTNDPTDSTSLAANWVECLYIDREGTLWVGTYGGGLNRFDPETETFTRFQHDPDDPTSLSRDSVTVILEDHTATLWVGTMGGLNRFDRETETFTHYRHDPENPTSLGNDQVRALFEDRRGTLWVGTNSPFGSERDNPGPGGLNQFDRQTETFTRYLHDPDDPQSLMSNHVMSLYEDSRGTLWVGTMGNVLHAMDRDAGTFERLAYDPDTPGTLGRPANTSLLPSCYAANCGGITLIDEDNDGTLWIGAFQGTEGGIYRYDPETGVVNHHELDPENPSSQSTDWVWATLESRDGTRWISLLGSGLLKAQSRNSPFEHHTLSSAEGLNWTTVLHVGPSGRLWVGVGGGLATFLRLDRGTSPYRTVFTRDHPDVAFAAITHARDGTLWIGTYEGTRTARHGGLYRLDPDTGSRSPVLVDSTRSGTRLGPVMAIHEDDDGTLWLGTRWSGLFQFDPSTAVVNNHFAHDPDDPTSLSHDNVTTLYEAPSEPGVLWIGTEGGGLNRFDPATETFTRYLPDPDDPTSLSGSYVTSLYEDARGHLWVGTRRSGLNRFDRETETFARFNQYNSGLPDDHVACVLGDDRGYLWLHTDRKLTRLNPTAERFYTYGPEHGVQAAPFVAGACDRDEAGALVFGGVNGFVTFDPDAVHTERPAPPVVVTGFLLARQPVDPDPKGPLGAPLHEAEEIRLAHDQHTFSFEFAALDYRDPGANQYAYRLEGYDANWREAGTLRQAHYARVPPGEYVFRVKAAGSDGVWNEQGASIAVTVLPPWWRTTWAYGLYGLLLVGGIFAVDRFQRRRLIRREREKARERELEQEKAHARELEAAYRRLQEAHEDLQRTQQQLVQQEKMASLGQLTAGIAHEIKNPLNFINNFAEVNEELAAELRETLTETNGEIELILSDLEQNAAQIAKHGRRADGIVRSMMQHARGGPGEREAVELNALVGEYVDLAYHGKRASTPDFNVEIECDLGTEVGEVEAVPQELGRVILNLVGNAFDAVHEVASTGGSTLREGYTPTVRITTRRTGDQVELRVADNGPGIDNDSREKIFEPFFTTKPTGSGTGLGLSLSYDIVTQGHGGSISVESSDGDGTTFLVILPTR